MEVVEIPKLYIGKGTIKSLKDLKGKSILVVTDKIVQSLDFYGKILKYLKKTSMNIGEFNEVEPDPSDIIIEKGLQIAKNINPEWFIAIGGGSSIDTAKAIQFSYETGEDIKKIDAFKKYSFKSKLIAIPTTSGTGSESSAACVITDTSKEKKITCINSVLTPYMAILDPKIPSLMPKSLTLSTALDALVHSFESLLSNLTNEFSIALSIHSINLILYNLPDVLNDLENVDLREKIHIAALMAGIAMTKAGLGLCHGIGHSLGAVFHIPHGLAVGISLPYVLEYSKIQIKEKLNNALKLINIPPKDFDSFISYLKGFFKTINAPLILKEFEISKEDLDKNLSTLIDLTMTDTMTIVNPRSVSREHVEKILLYMYDGKSIDF
ncbi:MAG: iron-containing alcohol dehydrogenase [Candidatus Lokiarchaeota archaeon]|nr:iron-containing alcohol dehydrogenase [Candidatus Lokiarchaeota archaeon]